jgi:D-alanyl-D-alanine carboxypeptidase
MLHWVTGPAPAKIGAAPENDVASLDSKSAPVTAKDDKVEADVALPRPAAARSGWMIQIGATDDAAQADALLVRAKARRLSALDDAQAFTEKVQRGEATLYRARFAGLDADDAEAACKSLKRSGFACFATKN